MGTNCSIILLGLFAIFYSSHSVAGVLVEPMVGSITNGSLAGDTTDGLENLDDSNSNPWEVTGNTYGIRIGFQHSGIFGSLDGVMTSGNESGDFESNLQEWSVVGGYQFPFLLRLWAGYVYSASLSGENKADDGTKQEIQFTKGTGTKFGMGFNPFPYISLNFEVKSILFKEFEFKQNGSSILDEADFEDDISAKDQNKFSYYLLSLSVPLEL